MRVISCADQSCAGRRSGPLSRGSAAARRQGFRAAVLATGGQKLLDESMGCIPSRHVSCISRITSFSRNIGSLPENWIGCTPAVAVCLRISRSRSCSGGSLTVGLDSTLQRAQAMFQSRVSMSASSLPTLGLVGVSMGRQGLLGAGAPRRRAWRGAALGPGRERECGPATAAGAPARAPCLRF